MGPDNNRMSKSKGNVIVPETVADKYGVDVIRMYLMFMGPFEGTMAWNEKTLMGVKRFLDRFEKFVVSQIRDISASKQNNDVLINRLIKEVGSDIENFSFNTAIAKQMKAINDLTAASSEELKVLVKLLAPFAPYMAEELWSRLRQGSDEPQSVQAALWPKYEEKYLVKDKVKIPVAVNGKVRGEIEIDNQRSGNEFQKEILEEVRKLEEIKKWIDGRIIVKEIYVRGKMVNLVVKM